MYKKIFKSETLVILALLLTLTLMQNATAAPVEVRGMLYDTGSTACENISWDFRTFTGFIYPINKYPNFNNSSGERLSFVDKGGNPAIGKSSPTACTIDKGELVYSVKQFPDKYKVHSEESDISKVTFYYTIPLFGKTYCAIDNDATHLGRIIYTKKNSEDRRVFKEGETWDIAGGYSLQLVAVDIEGKKCYLTLNKNGKEIDSGVISTDKTNNDKIFTANATFGDGSEHTYFVTFVDSVFSGQTDNFAVLKYTWLLDKDKTFEVRSGDEYGLFEVSEATANNLILTNKNTIKLDIDGITYFTDDWYFKTSDIKKGSNGGYIIYPAMQLNVTEPQNTAQPAAAPQISNEQAMKNTTTETTTNSSVLPEGASGTPKPVPATNESTVEASKAPAQSSNVETPKEPSAVKAPGFTGITTICMMLVLGLFIRRSE